MFDKTGQRTGHESVSCRAPPATYILDLPATYIRNLVAVAHAHGITRGRGVGATRFGESTAEAINRAVGGSVRCGDGLEGHEGSHRGDSRDKAPDELHHAHGHGRPDGRRHGFDGQGCNLGRRGDAKRRRQGAGTMMPRTRVF